MKKDQKETIEVIKVKEVAGGKCWKNIGLEILSVTGKLENHR